MTHFHGIHASQHRESVLIRSAAEAKIREADRLDVRRLERDYVAGAPAMPSPGDPRAEPTIRPALHTPAANGRAVTLGRPLVRVGAAGCPFR